MESIRLVRSIIVFDILSFFRCMVPITLKVSILQDLCLVGVNELFHAESGGFIVSDNIVKNSGNFEGIVKTTFSTVVDGDGKLDITRIIMGGSACTSNKSSKKRDCFIRGCFIF